MTHSQEVYYFYKAHGICTKCHQEDALRGHVLCAVCKAKQTQYNHDYYEQTRTQRAIDDKAAYEANKLNGICVACKCRPARSGKTTCEKCAMQRKRYAARRYVPVVRSADQCLLCESPVEKHFKYCSRHLAESRERLARARESRGCSIWMENWYVWKPKQKGDIVAIR